MSTYPLVPNVPELVQRNLSTLKSTLRRMGRETGAVRSMLEDEAKRLIREHNRLVRENRQIMRSL